MAASEQGLADASGRDGAFTHPQRPMEDPRDGPGDGPEDKHDGASRVGHICAYDEAVSRADGLGDEFRENDNDDDGKDDGG